MPEYPSRNKRNSALRTGGEIPSFRVGACGRCEREVLAAREVAGDRFVDICLHCGDQLTPDEVRWVAQQTVTDLGYVIDGVEDEECDSHGGCRDGSCGVQQPER